MRGLGKRLDRQMAAKKKMSPIGHVTVPQTVIIVAQNLRGAVRWLELKMFLWLAACRLKLT